MANLIVCCDGTWNTPDDTDGGLPSPTNVVKIYNALAKTDKDGVAQEAYYHPGVGTDGTWWDKVVGGGTGEGLDRNVMSGYRWLAGQYRPGDRIFLFGFSRGAYTVRSLGGMISRCGLLDATSDKLTDAKIWADVRTVFEAYRARHDFQASEDLAFHNVAEGNRTEKTTKIAFIGVWDTVGALGIPDDLAVLQWLDAPRKHRFHDSALSDIVQTARHAIAMDERRQNFLPTLWTEIPEDRDVKQMWFPGVHTDVGGGYLACGLSDGALQWMIDEAKLASLGFRDALTNLIRPDHQGPLHDSVTGAFKRFKTVPRAVPSIATANAPSLFHVSALMRHANPPLEQKAYWETRTLDLNETVEFDVFARQRWNRTGLFLEANATYKFQASGEWMDRKIITGPGGTKYSKFQFGQIVQILFDAFGRLELLGRRLMGHSGKNLVFARRARAFPWFSLVGAIANDAGPKIGAVASPQMFLIGKEKDYVPHAGGYLYCFANDAWMMYYNNRGSVSLRVTRIR